MSAGPRRRPNADVYDDPAYDWRKHDPGLAEDLEAELFEKDNYARVTHGPDAAERDSIRHQEAVFLHGLKEALTEQLKGQDIRCTGAIPDGHGDGYLITCEDRAGRQYEARLLFDDAFAMHATYGVRTGQRIIHDLCGKILQARNRWFVRMQ